MELCVTVELPKVVVPAKAGTQRRIRAKTLGSRLRGNDGACVTRVSRLRGNDGACVTPVSRHGALRDGRATEGRRPREGGDPAAHSSEDAGFAPPRERRG